MSPQTAEPREAQPRARIGLLVPSDNTCVEPDCWAMAPPGVTFHSARMFMTAPTQEALERMTQDMETAARHLASAEVDLIVFACTSGSMLHGAGYDEMLADRIAVVSGSKALTTSTAVLEAFRALGVLRIAIGTPYPDAINERVRTFLEDNGHPVVSLSGLQLRSGREEARLAPSALYHLGRAVDHAEADAVFISCTNVRAAEIAERLEADLGKPVVTSNQATMWAALRRVGVRDVVRGYGRLLVV